MSADDRDGLGTANDDLERQAHVFLGTLEASVSDPDVSEGLANQTRPQLHDTPQTIDPAVLSLDREIGTPYAHFPDAIRLTETPAALPHSPIRPRADPNASSRGTPLLRCHPVSDDNGTSQRSRNLDTRPQHPLLSCPAPLEASADVAPAADARTLSGTAPRAPLETAVSRRRTSPKRLVLMAPQRLQEESVYSNGYVDVPLIVADTLTDLGTPHPSFPNVSNPGPPRSPIIKNAFANPLASRPPVCAHPVDPHADPARAWIPVRPPLDLGYPFPEGVPNCFLHADNHFKTYFYPLQVPYGPPISFAPLVALMPAPALGPVQYPYSDLAPAQDDHPNVFFARSSVSPPRDSLDGLPEGSYPPLSPIYSPSSPMLDSSPFHYPYPSSSSSTDSLYPPTPSPILSPFLSSLPSPPYATPLTPISPVQFSIDSGSQFELEDENMIIVTAYDHSLKSNEPLVLEKLEKTQVSDRHLVSDSAGNNSEDLQATQATPEDLNQPIKGLERLRKILEDTTSAPTCHNTIPQTLSSQDTPVTDILMPVKPETMFNIMIQLQNHDFQSNPLPPQTQYIWYYETYPVNAILNVAKIGYVKSPGQVQDSKGQGNDSFDQGFTNYNHAYPILSLAWLKEPVYGIQLQEEFNLDLSQPYTVMPSAITSAISFESLPKDFDITKPASSAKKFIMTHPAAVVTSDMKLSEDPPESFDIEIPLKYEDKVQNTSSDTQDFYDELENMPTDIILKIKPEHMANIKSQSQNHEFTRFMLPSTTYRIWFYENGPVDAIRYIASIGSVKFPGEIQDSNGIGNDEFDQDLNDSKHSYEILSLQYLPTPLTSDRLLQDFDLEIPHQYCSVPPSILQAYPYEHQPYVFDLLEYYRQISIHDREDWDPTSYWSPFPLEDRNSDWGIDPYDSDMPGLQDISSEDDSSMQEDYSDSDMSDDDSYFKERFWNQEDYQDEQLEALIQKPVSSEDILKVDDIILHSTIGPKTLYPEEQLLCRLEESSPISSQTPSYVFSITAPSYQQHGKPDDTFPRISRDNAIQQVMQESKDTLDQDDLYIAILKSIRSTLKYSIDRLTAKLQSTEWKQQMEQRLIGDPIFQYVCRECYYFRGSCCNPCIPSISYSRATTKADKLSEFNTLLRPQEIDFLQTAAQVFHLLHDDNLVDAIKSVLDTRFRQPQRVSTLLEYGFLGP